MPRLTSFASSMPRPPSCEASPLTSRPERECWELAWDSSVGKWYYMDRTSGKSSWTKPRHCTIEKPIQPARGPPVPKDLRPGWEAQWDPHHNCFYIFNRETQQRQWLMREAHPSTAETVHQDAKADGTTIVGKDAREKAMCKKGCGRPAAIGFTNGGNPFDTCCRGCALGGGHEVTCGHCASDSTTRIGCSMPSDSVRSSCGQCAARARVELSEVPVVQASPGDLF